MAAELGSLDGARSDIGRRLTGNHRQRVDTGLHAKGWTHQQVVDYIEANSVLPMVEIVQETDRYIADPGQALGYMVGRLELQRIRAAAEATLGDRFDIREFHDTVLGCGPLPLTVLDEVVREWAR